MVDLYEHLQDLQGLQDCHHMKLKVFVGSQSRFRALVYPLRRGSPSGDSEGVHMGRARTWIKKSIDRRRPFGA